MFLWIWMWCVWPFLAISIIPRGLTLHFDRSPPIFGDKGSNWPLPLPLPPINANFTDILKKLPMPSQIPAVYKNETDCVEPSCEDELLRAAGWLQNSINESVNPCEDFYKFTCGKCKSKWLSNNPVPAGAKFITSLNKVAENTIHNLYDLFVDPNPSPSKAINLAKSTFVACTKYNRTKPSVLLERINKFCGWPILHGTEWNRECFNLPYLIAKIRRSLGSCNYFLGSCNIFMGSVVKQNQHNASQQSIYLYQTHLGLGMPENYRNATKLEEYTQRIMGMIKVLASDAGIETCDEKIRHEVDKIVYFEKELATVTKHYKTSEELKASFKVGQMSKLTKIIPELNLTEYFKALLPIQESFQKYFASDPEVLFDVAFFEKLSSLLNKTDKTTLANYMLLRYVMEWSNKHLDDRLIFKKPQAIDKLKMDCINLVVQELQYASGAMYVRKFVGNDTKNAALEMVENIRDAFRTLLFQNTWMDPVTKKRSINKLAKVIPQIGFPDFFLHDAKLDAYYNELNFDENASFSSMLEKISESNIAKEFQKVLTPTDRNEFDSILYKFNGMFEETKNVISFAAASLQAPYFHKSFPNALNYGGLGMVIGHEFTHGFDDEIGSKYNEIGDEISWWEPETKANFLKQKQCMIDQYSAYRVPEMNMTAINGTLTEIENFADNGGIKEAYLAYQNYLKKLGHEEQRLPGIEHFTNEQLLFINFGIIWCSNVSEEMLKWGFPRDPHSPSRYRVNGPLQNLPEFAAAFNCPKGSPMNPEKKCRVW